VTRRLALVGSFCPGCGGTLVLDLDGPGSGWGHLTDEHLTVTLGAYACPDPELATTMHIPPCEGD
jgi:hypothetical protein